MSSVITTQPTTQPITYELRSEKDCSYCCCANSLILLPFCLAISPFTCIYNCCIYKRCSQKHIIYSCYPTKEHSNNVCLCVYSD